MARVRFLITLSFTIITACTSIDTPVPISETPTATPTTIATSIFTTSPPNETPELTATEAPRELVISTGAEPDTLYLYGTSMNISNIVQEAVYDGPNSPFASNDTWNIEEYDYGEGCE